MAWERFQPAVPSIPNNGSRKVMILVPHRGETDYREWSVWFKDKLQKPPGTGWLEQRGLSLTTNRTGLVLEALKSDAEFFFFLDDDVICPNDIIITLRNYNRPIVCGLYMAKKKKGDRGLGAWIRQEKGYAMIGQDQPGRLVQVDATGLGCALIHRSVLEKVSQPWFVWDWEGISEDFYFFEKVARETGIKPLIDMQMRCDHIGLFKMDTYGEFTTLDI
jgi:hypothetical protein